uniref:Pentatricopeptide repeat-containing protein n=1 Tax=Chenopodium quinoa TaxID=63459 RepID=A0A803LXD2_CHEQI
MKISIPKSRCFSSSSLPWISPLHYPKTNPVKSDPPPPPEQESYKKSRYISHERAIDLIKRENDPQRALEIFNKVSEQRGFNHNNATYATILNKLAKARKFNGIDALLRQMMYEPACRFHEGIFTNLMKHYSKCGMHEKVVEMFDLIRPYVRDRPSPNAVSTCLNLLVESNQMDLARKFLLNAKKNHRMKPNTCIYNILVKYHCRHGNLESAIEVVEEMKKAKRLIPM